MAANLRTSAHGFLAKIIVFLMAGMFVLWGIADMLRNIGGDSGTVATVAKTAITQQEFHNALRRHPNSQPVEVLESLIDRLLVEKEEAALGIAVNDDTVAAFLSNAPEFKGKDGRFDKALYRQFLESSGRSERGFVEDVRQEIGKKLVLAPIIGDIQVPEEMLLAQYRLQEEQRAANILVLTSASVASAVSAPSDKEIKAFYDANAKNFTAPEYRTLSYVALPLADVQAKIDVPDDEVARTYEERKGEFREPEHREVEDMQFDNEQDARNTAKALSAGKTFADVAKSAPLSNKDKTSLGAVVMQDLPYEAADKVFALKPGEVTEPIFTKFRWNIYSLSKIVPGAPQTLAQAKPAIVREIASREALDTAQRLMNGFEDALAGGSNFEQAAEKIGQKVHSLGPITRQAMMPNGTKADLPAYDTFLTVAFATAEKEHSQAVQAPDGSYFLVRVDSVTPEHVRPLAEVKNEAAAGALAEKTRAALEKMAKDTYDALHAGKPVAGLPPAMDTGSLKRASESATQGALKDKPLPRPLISELFRLPLHGVTHAYPAEDGSYMIATLTQVTPAPQKPDAVALVDIGKTLKTTLTEETLQRYINSLHGKYAITVNNAALDSVKNEGSSE